MHIVVQLTGGPETRSNSHAAYACEYIESAVKDFISTASKAGVLPREPDRLRKVLKQQSCAAIIWCKSKARVGSWLHHLSNGTVISVLAPVTKSSTRWVVKVRLPRDSKP